ncbi:hypothetical protein HAX54_023361 [Datura stramonium]|uniref:Uncharacterized protein n=1 Tax=Datura stramonium TaxID=4076 RepID=A0ABS8UWF5_DATST|nr:hypothetical protein [Datura stramonium]
MTTSLSEPLMSRRLYPVHLGIQCQSVTYPTKRCYKARTAGNVIGDHIDELSVRIGDHRLARMEEYYVSIKEKQSIHAEA